MRPKQIYQLVKWEIRRGSTIIATGENILHSGQRIEATLTAEMVRLGREHKGLPVDLTVRVVSQRDVSSFVGLVADRYCPDHPHFTALKAGIKPTDYGFCGACGKKTQWVFLEEIK